MSKIWKILNKNLVATVVGGLILWWILGCIQEGMPNEEVSEPEAPQNPQLSPVVKTPPKPRPGDVQTFTLPGDVKLEMVYCPAGRFTMGSPDGKSEYPIGSGKKPKAELGRWVDETPHEVTLTDGFWLGKYPVTQGQYKAIKEWNLAKKSYGVGDNNPIYNVSWSNSVAFCAELNRLNIAFKGYKFVLPTEAQWEYACRAGTTAALNNGRGLLIEEIGRCPNLEEIGWYDVNADEKTHPVGEKQPNEWGIYDMHGNVWEWCMDYCDLEEEVVTDTYRDGIVDPLCKTGEYRVLRGGSWINHAESCRSANRYSKYPGIYFGGIGFRLALIPE